MFSPQLYPAGSGAAGRSELRRSPLSGDRAGAALVIILAFLVLLAALVVAFFSRAISERQVSNSSANQTKADLLALGAAAQITADLKQEIADGSTPTTVGGITIYVPTAPANAVPQLVGSTGTGGLQNLVKRSVSGVAFSNGGNASNRAAAVNSATNPSLNNRFVSAARWNKGLLMPATGASDNTPLLTSGTYTAPDWILVARDGTNPKAWSTNLVTSRTGTTSVVGRYAYNIYDEGGLLDVNVAGYPLSGNPPYSTANSDPNAVYKRATAFADLTQLPGISAMTAGKQQTIIDSLVGWRNYASSQPAGSLPGGYTFSAASLTNYTAAMVGVTNGFLATSNPSLYNGQSDRMFSSRQALIRFLLQGVGTATDTTKLQTAFQYLGNFSRELNAPSFTPNSTRPKVQPGASYAPAPGYTDPSRVVASDPGNPNTYLQDDNFNPNLNLIPRRFPLSRLAWITWEGPSASASSATQTALLNSGVSQATINAGTASNILSAFGLVWNSSSGSWIYISPDGTGTTPATIIKFLKNIPSGRQPDFFETLQAAISVGSLGRDSDGMQYYNQAYEPGTSSTDRTEAQNVYFHVIQIGANIIDQADPDSYPTVIQFGGEILAGIENLPYITRIFDHIYPSGTQIAAEYDFEVWNPHQDLPIPGAGPTNLQIIGASSSGPAGGAYLTVNNDPAPPTDVTGLAIPFTYTSANESQYRSPLRLGSGIALKPYTGTQTSPAYINGNPDSTFALQYQVNGQWRTYHQFHRLQWQIKPSIRNSDGSFPEWFHQRVDPRTDRFGTSMNYLPGDSNFGAPAPVGSTIRVDANNGYFLGEDTPFSQGIFTFNFGSSGNSINAAKNSNMGAISDNTTASIVYYKDPDGQVRPADGADRSGTNGQPMVTGNFPSRPVIINRPFRSVGELGYVFRDVPWKSLDLFTQSSGDVAILDAFSISDAAFVAGHVNLNTRQVPVLQAALANAAKIEGTPSTAITASEAQSIAQALVTYTTTQNPLVNRTELLTKFGPSIQYSGGTLPIKTQQEAALRAIAGATNARTWNLLIDIVAQAGRYPSNASGLSNFVVEGERRYWLHIAIDRYTGQVVDQILEPVYE